MEVDDEVFTVKCDEKMPASSLSLFFKPQAYQEIWRELKIMVKTNINPSQSGLSQSKTVYCDS